MLRMNGTSSTKLPSLKNLNRELNFESKTKSLAVTLQLPITTDYTFYNFIVTHYTTIREAQTLNK